MTRSERIADFVSALSDWYQTHRRDLPWRDLWDLTKDDRAYRVWISEVMLQQTQVSRVIGSYKRFIQQFPHVQALAKASNRDVLLVWRGMGYNSRALRLRDGAREILEGVSLSSPKADTDVMVRPLGKLGTGSAHHDTLFPQSMDELLSINGIGPYTAGAIRTFAFDLPTPCIDTNIRRILHRTFVGPQNVDGTWESDDAALLTLMNDVMAAWIAAGHRGSDVLSALMDYGSLVQTKMNPKWDICVMTQKGIMKATPKNWKPPVRGAAKENLKKEPGRYVGSTYIPNRIFRGRIVEALRDYPDGLKLQEIGNWISPDYGQETKGWLDGLIKKLVQDGLLAKTKSKYVLAS